jgi:hypothetical protein
VVTLLAIGGLVLSIGALLVVVGIGESQIIASESVGTHAVNLWSTGWFDAGIALALLGILTGIVAIVASLSQAAARKEFPEVAVQVVARALFRDVLTPANSMYVGQAVHMFCCRVRAFNREGSRSANLSMALLWDLNPQSVETLDEWTIDKIGFEAAEWEPQPIDQLPPLSRMPDTLDLGPEARKEGYVFFPLPISQWGSLDDSKSPELVIQDHGSGRWITVPTGHGPVRENYDT